MEKEQYGSVIRFLFLDGKTCEEIKIKLQAVYKDQAPSITTIRYWFNEFKRGRTSVLDEERPGRPIKVTTEEMVNKIHDIVLADRQVKIREIAEIPNISTERVHNILQEKLGIRRLSARWVPRLLTVEQKRNCVTTSEHCLNMFKHNSKEFRRRYSKQGTLPGERAPKKAKTVFSAGKVMATVFWDSHGIIFIDYLENGKTITGQYYASLLSRFDAELKIKRPHLSKKKLCFTMITHRLTRLQLPRQNWLNYAMDYCCILPIRQI
ncbi:histone-lysine N-methyltransferase SETMAR-like [Zophobas morio]|uniref:histone-lysine N-methyltransferase SETMAR-like n=1 Tax=Zophobas morio TaxID=2755281 RepID=UPI003083AAAB